MNYIINVGGVIVMSFPKISEADRIKRLIPPKGPIRMVLDTDTYNEVDDQFAIAYALKSKDKLNVEAIYAAPFYNDRSNGPADGMEKSYEEILRILDKMDIHKKDFVFHGSKGYLKDLNSPQCSEAAEDLVKRAMESTGDPLYVVAIGAITNVASAILMKPEIIKNVVVIWLGGHAFNWPDTKAFNLAQDIIASRLVFDCGVPLVQIPCMGVVSHLATSIPELSECLEGKSEIGNYLLKIVREYTDDQFAWSKVIWDISTIAYLLNSDWVPTQIVHSPVLTDQVTWSFDYSRHFIRSAYYVYRDQIFKDLFKKLS